MKPINVFFCQSGFLRNENGATAIEYGLIASLVALFCLTTIFAVGNKLNVMGGNVGNAVAAAMN